MLSLLSLAVNAAVNQPWKVRFGLAKAYQWDTKQHQAEAEATGLTDHALIYYAIKHTDNLKWPFAYIRDRYIMQNKPVIIALIIKDGDDSAVGKSELSSDAGKIAGNLRRIITGEFDNELKLVVTAAAKTAKKTGVPITYRPLYEADGNWFDWGMHAPGNSPELFKKAWIHVVDLIKKYDPIALNWGK